MSNSLNTTLLKSQPELAVYEIPGGPDVSLRALRRIIVPSSGNAWATVTMGGVIRKVGVLTVAYMSEETTPASALSDEVISNPPSNLRLGSIRSDKPSVPDGLVIINLNLEPETPQNLMDVPGGFGDRFVPTTIVWEIRKLRREVWIMTVHGGVIGRNLSNHYNNEDRTMIEIVKGNLEPEDRGSWVIDASTKGFLGIVVEIADSGATICTAKTIWRTTLQVESPEFISQEEDKNPGVNLVNAHESLPKWKSPDISSWTHRDETFSKPPQQPKSRRLRLSLHCPCISYELRFEYTTGAEVGRVGTQILWSLTGEVEREWRRLEPQIRNIIWQTPPVSQ